MNKNKLVKIFSRIPVIETARLKLRCLSQGDYRDMYRYACREDVTRYLLWEPHVSPEYTARYLNQLQYQYSAGEFYDWAIEFKEDHIMIGTCGFTSFDIENNRAEIGYVINPDYWGKGIAAEAVLAVLGFGFRTLSLNRIEARYMIGNDRSRRVMEKCGMKFEGIFRSMLYVKGSYHDIGICSILHYEYMRDSDHVNADINKTEKIKSNKLLGWFNL
ncbi:MAG: GNAT family N-acetyltransferase [Eubacteriales bacterium]|nr:GNAT family N-acetyltransferase [Eubacteriales bacterium]